MTNYRSDNFEQGKGYPDLTTRHFSGPASTVIAGCLSPPRLQVNRRACRFGRYKNPRSPHSPPRASRGTAHPCSTTLTRHCPPRSARPIDFAYAGPFLTPGQRGRNGLPWWCCFWVATHTKVDWLYLQPLSALPHLPVFFSPSQSLSL